METIGSSNKPRLILADDHALLLDGLRKLLEDRFEVVETATDGRTAVAAFHSQKPDLLVLDIGLPQLNGIEVARQVRRVSPAAKILFVSMQTDLIYVEEAFRSGASGYVAKQAAAAELITAINAVLAGGHYLSPSIAHGEDKGPFDPSNPDAAFGRQLTPRQRQVLQLVAEGRTMKEIAQSLNISVRTVEFHKSGIMGQLRLRTTAELTRLRDGS